MKNDYTIFNLDNLETNDTAEIKKALLDNDKDTVILSIQKLIDK